MLESAWTTCFRFEKEGFCYPGFTGGHTRGGFISETFSKALKELSELASS